MDIEKILAGVGTVIAALATVIQLAPVKVYPLSWIGKLLGRAINGELITKVDNLEKELQRLRADKEEKDAIDCRTRILRFGDEVARGEKHSEEHFNQILQDMTDYKKYCRTHEDFQNDKAVITSERIKEIYKKCLETGDFL